jgi:DNA-binding XRE family transcriptional regulator
LHHRSSGILDAWHSRAQTGSVDLLDKSAAGARQITERNEVKDLLPYIDGHRLAERRKALGLTQAQAQVAEKMGVTKSRVSQVERGEVSTIEAVARYVQAIGGTIQISAVFGDDQYILRGTVTEAA